MDLRHPVGIEYDKDPREETYTQLVSLGEGSDGCGDRAVCAEVC